MKNKEINQYTMHNIIFYATDFIFNCSLHFQQSDFSNGFIS